MQEKGSSKIAITGGSTPERLYKSFLDISNQNFRIGNYMLGMKDPFLKILKTEIAI